MQILNDTDALKDSIHSGLCVAGAVGVTYDILKHYSKQIQSDVHIQVLARKY